MIDPKSSAARLKPLQRLAPSRFTAAAECPLREVLRINGAPQLLPTSAVAHVGTIIHKLLEEAAQDPAMIPDAAEARFNALLRDEEQRMAGTPDAIFLPLAQLVRDFGVRKRRAILAAANRARTARVVPSEPVRRQRSTGPEVWVASPHGEVGGYIDDVVREGETIVLRDYKSGVAAQPGTTAHDEGMQQLRLYAALYEATHEVWPVAVEIVPIDGVAQREEVDRRVCTELLERACALYRRTNTVVASYSARVAEQQLGRPAPDVCRWCEFRPVCSAYLTARASAEDWPLDAVGSVAALNRLGNGKMSIQINEVGAVAHIRGITPDAVRHPAFTALQPGVVAGLFNLKGRARNYEETLQTAIVLYERLDDGLSLLAG